MKRSELFSLVRSSLLAIYEPRLFNTERGYQGALQTNLSNTIAGGVFSRSDILVESEYQKSLRHHGVKIRPDLVIHIPHERDQTRTRQADNFAVIELKRRASASSARSAFQSLDEILSKLNYHVGIFVNIGSAQTHFSSCESSHWRRIRCFAAQREGEYVVVQEEWAV